MCRNTPHTSSKPIASAFEQPTRQPGSHRSALLRNNFSNFSGQKTLLGGVGISMAVIEEVSFLPGNFANAGTFLLGRANANAIWGLIFHDHKKEIAKCASRRWLR
jgi:hypothetical protein